MRQTHLHPLQLNALLVFLYWGVGRASVLLAPEPSYATGIWPSAGIAFVAVLCGGYRYLPGVFLGAALINLDLIGRTLETVRIGDSLLMATAIGGAAMLQAGLGAWLVRRFVGYPTALETPGAILRFLLLAGPVACLVGATLSTTVLYHGGAFGLEPVGVHWVTWWLGDTVGAILFGLIGLCLIGKPRTVWRPRRTSVAAPLLLACIPVVVAQVGTSFLLAQRQHAEFNYIAETATCRLEQAAMRSGQALSVLATLFHGSEHVTRTEFERVAARQLGDVPALGWIAWVPTGGATLEESLREATSTNGAGNGGEVYLFPDEGGEAPARFTPERVDAYMLPETVEPSRPRLFLPAMEGEGPGLLTLAVGGTAKSQPSAGHILASVDLAAMAGTIVPDRFTGRLNIRLHNGGGPARETQVLRQAGAVGSEAFIWQGALDFNGQLWHVDIRGLPGEYERSWVTHSLVTASAGIVYSVVLALLLLADSGHKFRVERFFARIAQPRTSRPHN